MGNKEIDLSEPPEITIEDELREWPQDIYTEVAEAEARGRQLEQISILKKKARRRLLMLLLFFLVFAMVSVPTWFYMKRRPSQPQAEIVKNEPRLDNSKLEVEHSDNKENFKETSAKVTENGEEILDVVQYEFYSSKFIVNNTELTNQDEMVKTFYRLHDQLTDAWIIVFAAASIEGHEDYNLRLCQRRLYAVRNMVISEANVAAHSYWGILAGENKIELKGIPKGREEEEEEKLAVTYGKKWLSEQRKLIIITIREKKPIPPELSDRVPIVVAKHLYDQGVLPKDYDKSDSTPFLLTAGDKQNTEQRPAAQTGK